MSDVFDVTPAALTGCTAALDAVHSADLGRPTPCPEFTVGQVIEHLHLAMVRLGGLAGATLQPEDPLPDLVAAALDAWRARGLDGTVELRGELAAERAAAIIPLELVVHGWDVATALGRSLAVDDTVAVWLLDAARDVVPSRRGKAFGAEAAAPVGATGLQQLLAFTGRRVTA